MTQAKIGQKVGKVIGRGKMGKHFRWAAAKGRLEWSRDEEAIEAEAALDGIYVIRASEPKQRLSPEDTVRSYKSLAHVERALRTLKGVDVRIRPIRHRTEEHMRARIFLCLLAYYVEWHMRRAWAPLLFDDEQLPAQRGRRDPVARAEPSASARAKKTTRTNTEGLEVQSLETLLAHLATRCRCYCRTNAPPLKEKAQGEQDCNVKYERLTEPTPLQTRALQLLGLFPVDGNPH